MYIYIYTYVCIYVCTYVSMYICIFVFTTKDAVRQEIGLINQLTSRSEAEKSGTKSEHIGS